MTEQGTMTLDDQNRETRAVRMLRLVWRVMAGLFALAVSCAVIYSVMKLFHGYRMMLLPWLPLASLRLLLAMVALWLVALVLLLVVLGFLVVRLIRKGRIRALGGLVSRLAVLLVAGGGLAVALAYEDMRTLGDPSLLVAPRAAIAEMPRVFTENDNAALEQKLLPPEPAAAPAAADNLFLRR